MISKFKKFFLIFLLAVLTFSVSGCKVVDKETKEAMKPVILKYWRVWEGAENFGQILTEYNKIHPNIVIDYKKLTYEEYEEELLNAFAEGRGPDIFSINNTWMTKYKNKLLPLPSEITLPYQYISGSVKKELITEMRTTPSLTNEQVKEDFIPVVAGDVLLMSDPDPDTGEGSRQRIYGLPLSVDTMVLFYNRDLLNNAGVSAAPASWTAFKDAVMAITRVDKENNIVQSAAAFGTYDNIDRSYDLITLLMIQNGTDMVDSKGNITFNKIPSRFQIEQPPAEAALRFYTDFASPIKEVYTWNDDMPNSLEAFVQGKTAFFFGYSYHLSYIKAETEKPVNNVKFGIAPMPQIQGNPSINTANYWVEVVSEKTEHVNEAWDFVQFMTSAEQAETYLQNGKKPTARKELINKQLDDLELGVFAEQLLTAQSWYKGYKPLAVEEIIGDIVNKLIENDSIDAVNELNIAAQKVQQTLADELN